MAQDRRPAVPGAERPTEMGRYRFKKGGPTPIAPPLTKMAPSARLRPAAGAALIPPPWPCPGSDAADWPVPWGGAGDWRAAGGARGALGARRALPGAISGSCLIPAPLSPGRAPGHAVRARAGPAELVAAFPSGEAA